MKISLKEKPNINKSLMLSEKCLNGRYKKLLMSKISYYNTYNRFGYALFFLLTTIIILPMVPP
jgi:hypothetical protein